MKPDFSHYQIVDFLTDDTFRTWARSGGKDPALDAFWRQVQVDHPGIVPVMEDAIMLVRELAHIGVFDHEAARAPLWEKINRQIGGTPIIPLAKPGKNKFLPARVTQAAVILLLLTGTAWLTWRLLPAGHSLITSTRTGQIESLQLPDSSSVTLFANSSLTWSGSEAKENGREVWLRGTALFNVRRNRNTPQPSQAGFIVHLENGAAIEVLGTEFSVQDNPGRTSISLVSGKVKITTSDGKEQILKPGETLEISKRTNNHPVQPDNQLTRTTDHPMTALQEQQPVLLLKNTAVRAIISTLQDTYGRQMVIQTPVSLDKKVEGSIPLNNEKEAMAALSSILQVKIRQDDGHWYFIAQPD